MKQFLVNNLVVDVTSENPKSLLAKKIDALEMKDMKSEEAFYIADLGDIVRKFKIWTQELPRVEPFYAVKCNDDPGVLAMLAQLGTGFDCASKGELKKILSLNVDPERIVFANPCKMNSHINYASKNRVRMMTFDNAIELHKIKQSFPNAKLIIRIAPENTKAVCPLGMKYGCSMKSVTPLLKLAQNLDLDVIGVSFHVGSGCLDASAYPAAVRMAKTTFDIAENFGFRFSLLDIGGGFPGQDSAELSFDEICTVLKPALDTYFPPSSGVRIIAEPGRFFVASAFTLAVNVIAKRVVSRDDADECQEVTADDEPRFMYYVNDGVYGSFNCLLYDHAQVQPTLLQNYEDEPTFTSSIWGPTCDGLDCISQEVMLPELFTGSWIIFRDMGAYTMSAASNFNGMPKPRCYHLIQDITWMLLNTLKAPADKRVQAQPLIKFQADSPVVEEFLRSPALGLVI